MLEEVKNLKDRIAQLEHNESEHRQLEDALCSSEERLKAITDNSTAVIYVKDLSGRYILVNRRYETLFHVKREDMIGKTDYDMFPKEMADVYRANDNKVVETGAPIEFEETALHDDGIHTYISLKFLLHGSSGKPYATCGISTDITERKRIEQELKEKTKSLANAQRIARLGNWDLDIVNNRLYWSDEIYRIFGAKPQEFGATYEAFLGFVHPDDMESVKKAVNEALYDRKPYSIHHLIVLAEGGERIVHEQAEVVFDEQGKPVKMSGTVQDITEWKKAEEGHSLLSAAVAQSTDCVVITDLDGTIVYVNPAFERNTGYSAAQAIGKKPNILKSEKHSSEYYSKLWFALKSRGSWSGILINKSKDGTLFEEETNISTVSDSKGRPEYYVEVKRDVTNERRLEEQLRHAQKMEAVGQLTGGIAHDFNNFLTAIIGFGYLLQMKLKKSDPLRHHAEQILVAAERASNLTHNLLAFSSRQETNARPVRINDIVKRVKNLLSKLIGENIEFTMRLADEELTVLADSGQVEQVLMNL